MKKRTKTYRRDVPRKGLHWGQTKNEEWDNALKELEQRRSKLPTEFEREHTAKYVYDFARTILEEVGDVKGIPEGNEVKYWKPEKRKEAMQELLTRISHVLDPKDQGNPNQGKGKGKGQRQPSPHPEDDDEEEEEDEEYEPGGSDGGGRQRYSEGKDQSIFYATRFLIKKLAEHDDRTNRQVFGHDTWNAQKLMAAHYKPNELPQAKEGWGKQIDDIYLCLDTSGSVDEWAELIAGVAAGSAGIVHLYSGSEANPTMYVDRHTPLKHPGEPFPEWTHQKSMFEWTGDREDYGRFARPFVKEYQPFYPYLSTGSFETQVAWFLKTQKPKKGSRLLFWGDTEGVGIMAPKLLKQLVAPYRMAWLYSEEFWLLKRWQAKGFTLEDMLERHVKAPDDYTTYEYPKLMAVGIPVIPGITSPEGFRRALRQLQLQK